MINTTRFGAGCLLSHPEILPSRAALLESRTIGHVQLMMIPLTESMFQQNIEVFEPYAGKIRIHAPHHFQGVNPADPELFSNGISGDIHTHIETAMNQTLEAADHTGSEVIVIHAGRYEHGHRDEAVARFHDFLDRFPDPRYSLESLPDLQFGPAYLGTTPEELKLLGGSSIKGYCPDFPHLWCTSSAQGIIYQDLLDGMSTLPLSFSHLSGSPGPGSERQHLLFDDPDNQFTLPLIRKFLLDHQDLELSLEFAVDDPAVITRQVTLASSL
ncbi:MAG: hypothetical protein LUQ50_06080 [Methanospirillum sp.]|uniref:hypothetical protein n=1 Tax=Methanospirillum sp. TaxID=45200 RepID=UPI00236C0E3A|nr:hypothetical protein [Methanospirillum sp.]MDD1728621.1 hypothetical protein [Methanospirillum sp.]